MKIFFIKIKMDINYILNEESPKCIQPENINIILKPHQLTSLYKMSILDKNCEMAIPNSDITIKSNIGILADLSGYGKTITFLSLIEILKNEEPTCMPQSSVYITDGYGLSIIKESKLKYINTSLVVVPDNLVSHWKKHLEFYTELSFEIIETDLYNKIIIEEHDLIVCSALHYNKFIKENEEYCWNRVAFDEADAINIPNTEYIKTRFLWFITATFENIPKRKNKGFMKTIFKQNLNTFNDCHKYFYPIVIKNVEYFVKKSFDLIDPDVKYIDCLTPKYIQVIQPHINAYVLELINAGNIDGAIIALGGNVDNDHNIIDLITKSIKNDIIIVQSKLDTLDKLEINDNDKKQKKEPLEKKLQSLNIRKENIEKSILDINITDCIICYELLKNPTIVPCCNNIFCAECLLIWIKEKKPCPICRKNIETTELKTIKSDINSIDTIKKDKTSTIIEIIKNNPNGKFIIFSGHSATFKKVGKLLKNEKIVYGTFTSSTQTEITLKNLCTNKLSVILLDTDNNGAGIEVPQATDIILFHEMSECLEKQAIARAQRPGREGQLRVWKLKYTHEYKQ